MIGNAWHEHWSGVAEHSDWRAADAGQSSLTKTVEDDRVKRIGISRQRPQVGALEASGSTASAIDKSHLRPSTKTVDRTVRKRKRPLLTLQDLRLDTPEQKLCCLLSIVDLADPVQEIPGDLQRVLDERW